MQSAVRILCLAVCALTQLTAAPEKLKPSNDVPEPAGYILIGAGLIAISFIGRRKQSGAEG